MKLLRAQKNAVIHLYNSTSLAQREQVFKKSKEEILNIAVEGAKLLKKLTEEDGGNYRFEYSPESFTGTEVDYAWRSAMPYWIYGSQLRTTRSSSICR